ncbi:TPR repeat-containing protein (plasmid) [Calothrix sp. NIES-4101]|nr:TPR repeat-containing protein [Calothrix sp. NIES-4101]
MNNRYQIFPILILAIFLVVTACLPTFSQAQSSVNPSQVNKIILSSNSSEDKKFCQSKHPVNNAVCLDEHFLFRIKNNQPVRGLKSQERATEISNIIKQIADDYYIDIDSLKIEKSQNNKFLIFSSPNGIIFTMTDDDAKAEGFEIQDKRILAENYLQLIKHHLKIYRHNLHLSQHYSWIEIIKNNIFIITSMIILFLLFFTLFANVTFYLVSRNNNKHNLLNKLMFNNTKFITEFFGFAIEVSIIAIIFILMMRLLLIIFNDNFDFLFSKNYLNSNELTVFSGHITYLIQIIGLIFIVGIIFLLFRWLSNKGEGTVVIPFQDTTNDEKYNGKAIADSLIEELYRISQIQTLVQSEGEENIRLQSHNFPPLNTIQENLGGNLLDIGTVELGQTKLPIGKILLGLRFLWPFGGVNKVISGSIQAYGQKIRLVVRLAYKNEMKAWEVTRENITRESLPEMLREISYKVSMYLAPDITAQTWEGFKFFTEATANYYQYRQTKIIKFLKKAESKCNKSKQAEKNYKKIADLFYNIGVSYFEEKKYDDAERVFIQAISINHQSKFFHNGLGNVYLRKEKNEAAFIQYKLAIDCDKSFPYPYNGLGNIYAQRGEYEFALKFYNQAIQLNSNFWKPHYNKAVLILYHQRDDFLTSINKAINQYQKAKNLSQGKVAGPYAGIGFAYFLQAINLSQDYLPDKDLLEEASIEMQKAIDIDGNEVYYHWNFGLIMLWLGYVNETQKSWEQVLNILSKSNTIDKFCPAIYEYAIKSLPNNKCTDTEIDNCINSIKNILTSQEINNKKGIVSMMLKDLESILLIPNPKHRLSKLDELIKILRNIENNLI